MPSLEGKMVVLDIETTGLEPEAGLILEVGAAIVDVNTFGTLDVFHTPVFDEETIDFIQNKWRDDDFAKQMHDKSGLTAQILRIWDDPDVEVSPYAPGEAEWNLVSFLRKNGVTPDHTEPLAGSSVHFDRKWLEAHMPTLADQFGYRNIDASAFSEYIKKKQPVQHRHMMKEVDEETKRRCIYKEIGRAHV